MHDKWKCGLSMLGGALALGVAADLLLRQMPWGLNVFLWAALFVVVILLASYRHRLPLAGGGRWLLLGMLGFAAAVAWRDSPTLKICNLLAIVCSLPIIMLRGRFGDIRNLGIVQAALCFGVALLNIVIGPVLLIYCDLPWRTDLSDSYKRSGAAVLRGIVIAIPLLLAFVTLFVAADARFAEIIKQLCHLDAAAFLNHGLLVLACAWAAGGFIRGTLIREDANLMTIEQPDWLHIGFVEISIVLASINTLFLFFVCVQATYFFGGQSHVIATAGLTAADYARRGFFELVTVAGLVLPLLLIAEALLREDNTRGWKWFRALASVLILLTFLVMASAVQRMALYHIGFGMTELRFYTTAFMGWLALAFLWYGATVLRRRREIFVFGAVVSAFACLAVLNIVNPDSVIVRVNAARLAQHRSFDADYAGSLSADAVPELIQVLPRLSDSDRHKLADLMCKRWIEPRADDWRVWSVDRAAANAAAKRSAQTILTFAGRN